MAVGISELIASPGLDSGPTLTAMEFRQIEQSCEYEDCELPAPELVVIFLRRLCVLMLHVC
jgi:hypothetical protein